MLWRRGSHGEGTNNLIRGGFCLIDATIDALSRSFSTEKVPLSYNPSKILQEVVFGFRVLRPSRMQHMFYPGLREVKV